MSRFNTGNPLGSNDPRDLDDNAKNLDLAVNSEEAQWIDRFGRPRLPLMEQERLFVAAQERHEDEFQSDQEDRSDRFNDFIASSGYQFAGDYGPGIEITEYNQLIRDSNGEFWRVSGQVDLPYVTTGAGIPEDDALVPAGDAVLRQDLANPDMGAAMVARGVVAVDSIADLLALPEGQRKEGLRYLVKGYHAGSDVGGGEFYWDGGRVDENDHGTVFYGFVRSRTDRMSAFDFGGDSFTGDCFSALQVMIDHVLPGGEVSTLGWTGEKVFDASVSINKPCRVMSHSWVTFRLADQSELFHSTANRRSKSIVEITSSDVTFKGFVIDSNKLNNWSLVGGRRFFFLEEPAEVGASDAEFRYLGTIAVNASSADRCCNVQILDNRLYNCSVHGIGVSGPFTKSHFETHGAPSVEDYDLYTQNVTVSGNYIHGGCRSGIYFINGVVNSVMERNEAEDWAWAALRFYYGTGDCTMRNNTVRINKDIPHSEYESSEGNISTGRFSNHAGCGYRVGHPTRAPGTCARSTIEGNAHYSYGSGRLYPGTLKAIGVESLSKDTAIINNTVVGVGNGDVDSVINGGVILIFNPLNIIIKGNTIDSVEYAAIRITGANDTSVSVINNSITYSGDYSGSDDTVFPRGIYVLGTSGAGGADTHIRENHIEGYVVACEFTGRSSSIKGNTLVLKYPVPADTWPVQCYAYNNTITGNVFHILNGTLPAPIRLSSITTGGGVVDLNRAYITPGASIPGVVSAHASSNAHVTADNISYVTVKTP